ncbi:MAG: bifunctional methylenetetrahydrofolate dehydrogenase/methenyltetrahydrofolate cyclohydrolase FolD [Candidatus Margulisiibacteriota bacterium]
MGETINGKAIAQQMRDELKIRVERIKMNRGIIPKLVAVLVGEDPASQIYVRNKERAAAEIGMIGEVVRFTASASEKDVLAVIKGLNADSSVHGFIVQLPMPKGMDEKKILKAISPQKDVDGMGIENLGRLLKGESPYFLSCTPSGIMRLILSTGFDIQGKEAVVVGRSNIVGKPVALMLLEKNATVTVCHSRTTDLASVVRRGDVVVAAVGKAGLIKGDWIKPGAVVIDVGMNRIDGKLYGDVDYAGAKERASYITPVPGGVGPMTIAMLLQNTVIAAERA